MAQTSGPISQGTLVERQFTDVLWRDLFGDEPGVISDMNGSSYALSLPGSSDIVSVGSSSQMSLARVAGFVHKIVAGSTEPITVPPASGSSRTDILALRYDPAYTGSPGPVRLVRIAGTSAEVPIYDATPGGIEELPLWSITRSPGQLLSAATTNRMFPRLAPVLDLPANAPLPINSPLGTRVYRGTSQWRRALDTSNNPAWLVVGTDVTSIGRAPITNASKVNPDAGLTAAIAIPARPVPYRVVVQATGRTGFDTSARDIGWDFDSIPGSATNVTKDSDNTRITAPAGDFVAVNAAIEFDMPAGVDGAFRLVMRSSGPAYNRGSAVWMTSPR